MVVATGEMGELGIAPRHAPLITRLKPGKVVRDPGERRASSTSSSPAASSKCSRRWSRCWPTPRSAPRTSTRPQCQAAKEEAERILANRGDAMEIAEAQAKLAEAMAQLQALERLRKNLKH